jgi:hypothetical protein
MFLFPLTFPRNSRFWPCLGGLHASAMISSPVGWAPLPDSHRLRRPRKHRSVRKALALLSFGFIFGMAIGRGDLPRDKSAKRRIVPRPQRGDGPLRDGLVRRSARLGSSGIQYASGPTAATGQIDVVDVFTNEALNTPNGLPRGKLENGCECYRTAPESDT